MKNKLHTMLRQAQQPQAQQPNQQLTVTEPSRSAASHPVCHSVGISKYKASHFKILLFSILYSLSPPLHNNTNGTGGLQVGVAQAKLVGITRQNKFLILP